MLLARAMLAYIFIVDPRLRPLVIGTELGGGLLVLIGLKVHRAAVALSGFCLLTALLIPLAHE